MTTEAGAPTAEKKGMCLGCLGRMERPERERTSLWRKIKGSGSGSS